MEKLSVRGRMVTVENPWSHSVIIFYVREKGIRPGMMGQGLKQLFHARTVCLNGWPYTQLPIYLTHRSCGPHCSHLNPLDMSPFYI